MSDGPLISIVLPTYNGSRYLRGAVASLRRQTYPNWELLLQDDCSTDTTPSLIAELAAADPRIKPARNPVNLRLPRSLNAGFARARGEFLTWTSDDNEHQPGALEALLSILQREPEVGLVYSDMLDIDDEGRTLGPWRAPEPDQLGLVNSVGASFLYRREVAQQVGDYDDRWRLVEDWDYWLRLAQRARLRPLHQELYRYRRHAASLTTTRAQEIERIQMEMLAVRLPELPGLSSPVRARAYLRLARMARTLSEPARAREFEGQAWRLDRRQTAVVLAGRWFLGADRAGALRNWFRR